MADADFTIASKVVAPKFDLMGSVAGAAAARQGILGNQQGELSNRLLGIQVQGKQAMGEIIGRHTDPQGNIDAAAVSAEAAKDPAAALLLQEFQSNALQRQLSQVQLERDKLHFTGEQWSKVGGVAMSVLGKRDKDGKPAQLTPDDVKEAVNQLVTSGQFHDPESITRLTSFVTNLPTDPEKLRGALKGVAIMANPTAETVGLVNGAPSMVETGGQQQAVQTSGLTGEVAPLTGPGGQPAVFKNTLSPTAKAVPRGYVDEAGAPHQVTTGALVTDTGDPKVVEGITGANGETATGLAPGVAEARAAPLQARGARATEIESSFEGSVRRAALLDEAGAALKDFRSGPGAARWSKYVTEVNRATGLNLSTSAADAEQVFAKIAVQVAAQQGQAMGLSNTNAQAQAAQMASLASEKSPEANAQVRAILRGNEDYIQARSKAWAKYQKAGGKVEHLDEFERQFNEAFDPRFFQDKYMTATQRGAMAREMGKKKWADFQAQEREALKYSGVR